MGLDKERVKGIITTHFATFKNEALWKSKVSFENDEFVEFKALNSYFMIDRAIRWSRLLYSDNNGEAVFVDYFRNGNTHSSAINYESLAGTLRTLYPPSEFESFNADWDKAERDRLRKSATDLSTMAPPPPPFGLSGRDAVIARSLRLPSCFT